MVCLLALKFKYSSCIDLNPPRFLKFEPQNNTKTKIWQLKFDIRLGLGPLDPRKKPRKMQVSGPKNIWVKEPLKMQETVGFHGIMCKPKM